MNKLITREERLCDPTSRRPPQEPGSQRQTVEWRVPGAEAVFREAAVCCLPTVSARDETGSGGTAEDGLNTPRMIKSSVIHISPQSNKWRWWGATEVSNTYKM